MRYIPHSREDVRDMLAAVSAQDMADLFRSLPPAVRLNGPLPIPAGKSELEVERYFAGLAKANTGVHEFTTFLGAGAYSHYIPAITDALVGRSEFLTAYTPYQPEVSQGTLQALFEYQSMVSLLTGMEVTNASMYDGATAVTEAVLMAHRVGKGNTVLVARSLHPFYRDVLRTYTRNFDIEIVEMGWTAAGQVDPAALAALDAGGVFAVVAQSPNFLGVVEDLRALADRAHASGALLVAAFTEALSLAALESPGSQGADIVAGEGQSFGIPLSFGGPYLGVFSTSLKHVRKMPGRVAGLARDAQGRRGFVLTLSAREQHIRREKATSNICTNQGLCALMACIYLASAGRTGLRETAGQNLAKARYAIDRLTAVPGVSLRFTGPVFNEFALTLPVDPHGFARYCQSHRLVPGVPMKWFYPELADELLVCVTETNRREEIDALADTLTAFCARGGLL